MSGVDQEQEYRTIKEISARGYSVKEICEILGVSRSGYYKWTNRKRSDRECENEQLLRELRDIYHAHRCIISIALKLMVNSKRLLRSLFITTTTSGASAN